MKVKPQKSAFGIDKLDGILYNALVVLPFTVGGYTLRPREGVILCSTLHTRIYLHSSL